MPRILFIVERYYPDIGGLARSGQRIAETLADLGWEVDVFVLAAELESGQARSESTSPRLTIHRFGKSKQIDFTLQQATIFLEWLHGRGGGQQPIDLVWSHYAMSNGFLGIWFAKHFGIRSVLAVRGNDVDRQFFPPGDLSRLEWSLKNATRVISVSQDLANKVNTIANVDASVLPNSVDADLFSPRPSDESLRHELGIRPEHLVLVFTGELRAKKGLPMLIECYRQMALKRPTKLLIVGEIRAKELGRFQRATAGLENAQQDILTTGHLPDQADVVKHLRLADFFLLPSLWDGLPNSLLEAMAVGVPVAVSDAGAIGDVVQDGQSGLVIPRMHLHQMAQRIEMFLSKPAVEREAMINTARDYVVQHHSPQAEREQLKSLVTSTLEQ